VGFSEYSLLKHLGDFLTFVLLAKCMFSFGLNSKVLEKRAMETGELPRKLCWQCPPLPTDVVLAKASVGMPY